ncbi:hypothetical protein GIB67_035221 [Kingdonia uniflora]|uniref:Uncharacterized protein n=1 Tax=Kingdonia uniflora TaxID=39325 RepID=A0A7J7KXP9_9MAGN|nr:hypothetical protein GIB67_035221 [Kingdonia uniflora]
MGTEKKREEMGHESTSKDLLELEHKPDFMSSSLESKFLLLQKDPFAKRCKTPKPQSGGVTDDKKLVTTSIPRSQGKVLIFLLFNGFIIVGLREYLFHSPLTSVLGKVKDFLGVMAEANERLKQDPKDYDIEVLTGNEKEYIEMDLVLGVADLHTPEAVAAAESAISSSEGVAPRASKYSGSDTEESDDDDRSGDDCNVDGSGDEKTQSGGEPVETKSDTCNTRPKKRPNIVELP